MSNCKEKVCLGGPGSLLTLRRLPGWGRACCSEFDLCLKLSEQFQKEVVVVGGIELIKEHFLSETN